MGVGWKLGDLGEGWGQVFMSGLAAMRGHCQLSMLNLCRPAVVCHKHPRGLLDNHYIYYASRCQVLRNPQGLLLWLQVVPKEKLKSQWWAQQGRGPAAYLKRAHHHNHGNTASICTKNVRGVYVRSSQDGTKLGAPCVCPSPPPNGTSKTWHVVGAFIFSLSLQNPLPQQPPLLLFR